MQLSYRLKTIASYVSIGNRLADIGTDHGYVPIYLTQNKCVPYAIAMDINKGPLIRAEANIKKEKLQDKITTRISDGLSNLKKDEVDTILIAGMGGSLIVRILNDGIELLNSVKELVLSPHSEVENVRRFLSQNNFIIVNEKMLTDEGKFYIVLKAIKGNNALSEEIHIKYGKILLEEKNPILYQYLLNERITTLRIIENVMVNNTEKAEQRTWELKKELSLIDEALKYYEC